MNDTKDSLPEMLDPTDVCSAMDDLAFMEYCYSHFDVNHDHKVGLHEARAVREIDLSDSKVVSLRGIEYFSNLERLILDRSTVRELHLLQNTKLKEISAKECSHLNNAELPNSLSIIPIPNNEIWYTSTDGKIIEPHKADAFGANIVSNTYENGKGIISFDGDVISIGENAFAWCESIQSITIPDSVTSIGKNAFEGCSSLTSITIPDSVTKIGGSAFSGCSSLTSVYITDIAAWCSISFANNWANPLCFAHNLYLNGELVTDLTIPDSVTSIEWGAFWGCSSLTSITIPDSVTSIGKYAFRGCSLLTRITIPDSVTSIGDYTFRGCTSLTSITIPDSVTSIGKYAFCGCSSLKSIIIPDSVTSIEGDTFSNCTTLKSITIPDGVTSIGNDAFRDCTSLTIITIPASITEIEAFAFSDCTSLTTVYCKSTTPPELDFVEYIDGDGSILGSGFENGARGRKIYVPRQSVAAYKLDEGWKEYADEIVGYDFEKKEKVVAKRPKEVKPLLGYTDFIRQLSINTEAKSKKTEVEPIKESPYYIFFDTETTGIPDDFKAPASDTDNWPRLVQLAWIVASKSGKILKKESRIIYPDGFIIPRDASKVHGITTAIAKKEGEDLDDVLAEFGEDLADTTVMVGHNLDFDCKILHAEYIRLDDEDTWDNGPEKRRCTMKATVSYCKIPNKYGGYKWPKLQELHEELFGYEFDDAHNALADIEATFKCYWELRKLGLID